MTVTAMGCDPADNPAGSVIVMELADQITTFAAVPPTVTVEPPCDAPKAAPESTTDDPVPAAAGAAEFSDGNSVNGRLLLACPATVTIAEWLPPASAGGDAAEMPVLLQLVMVAGNPPMDRTLVPCAAPKLVPVIVIPVATVPLEGDRVVSVGYTVNVTELLATPPTVTTTDCTPETAAAGTMNDRLVGDQFVAATAAPPNVMLFPAEDAPKLAPEITTVVPALPMMGKMPDIEGPPATVTTKLAVPLWPLTVITTAWVPAPRPPGTVASMTPPFHVPATAATPPMVSVEMPCDGPKLLPVIWMAVVPAAPDAGVIEVITGEPGVKTVNGTALLDVPPARTTRDCSPPGAPAGTDITTCVLLHELIVAAAPPK